jgi:stage V sporulation protein SpoVS
MNQGRGNNPDRHPDRHKERRDIMKTRLSYFFITLSIIGVLSLAACARTKPGVPVGEGIELGEADVITAQVVGIDKQDRAVTLRGPQGNVTTVEVAEDIRNFDQIEVGDTVKVTYYEAVALYFGEPGTQPSADAGAVVARSAKGEKPGAYAVGAVDVSATVKAINRAKRTVTLKGADGSEATVSVDPSMKEFDNLRVGDTIHARYTEAIAVSVE